jgi:hypothetical protein
VALSPRWLARGVLARLNGGYQALIRQANRARAFHPKRRALCRAMPRSSEAIDPHECSVTISPGVWLQAKIAYTVGISGFQYTIRRVSPALDAELRREASETGKTLNTVVVQALEDAKLPSVVSEHDDLDWFIGHTPAEAGDEADAQAWLDALPVEPAA